MDPNTGRLYPDLSTARLAGVIDPVEISGRVEDVERVSAAVHAAWTREQKADRNAKRKAASAARRNSRT